jgi:hypothetical protein
MAAIALTAPAQAAHIMANLDTVTADGSNFKFSYSGSLTPDLGVVSGDQFVIVDFAGYVPGSISSTLPDVTASISNTLPSGLVLQSGATDNASIPDLVFTYTGADFHASGGPFPPLQNFSGLSADSTFGFTTNGSFSASAVKNVGANTGDTDLEAGRIGVPSAIPEPASWAMMLIGFFGLGTMLRRRKAKAPAIA